MQQQQAWLPLFHCLIFTPLVIVEQRCWLWLPVASSIRPAQADRRAKTKQFQLSGHEKRLTLGVINPTSPETSRPSLQGATRRHQIAPWLPTSCWALHLSSLIVPYCTGLINQIWSCKYVWTLLFWLVFNFTLLVHSKKGNVILCDFICLCTLLI